MPLSPMFLLLQLRYLRNLHHTLEGLRGWLVGQILEALCCLLGQGICYVAPGFVLLAQYGVGGPYLAPCVPCRLSDGGYIPCAYKVSYTCHPVFSQ